MSAAVKAQRVGRGSNQGPEHWYTREHSGIYTKAGSMFKSYRANERVESVSVGEVEKKGTRSLSAHVKPSGSAAAFQTDQSADASPTYFSGYALPVQPGESTWQHLPGAQGLRRSLSGHFHPYRVLTSIGPTTASIQTGRPDSFICLLSFPSLAVYGQEGNVQQQQ